MTLSKKSAFVFINICFLFGMMNRGNCQAPGWEWGISSGGSAWSEVFSMTSDASGNIYAAGWFGGTISFNGISLTSTVYDMFIVKYDGNGNAIWAKKAGGDDAADRAFAVTTDVYNNVYVTGTFASDTMKVDSISLVNMAPGWNTLDIFLIKYDLNGNLIWARSAGGASLSEVGLGVTTDMAGDVYIAGSFQSNYLHIGSLTLTNCCDKAIFIAKYYANGNVAWAHEEGGSEFVNTSITADKSGHIYMSNIFAYNASAGMLSNIKYNSNGNVAWSKDYYGHFDSHIYHSSVFADTLNAFYFTGSSGDSIMVFDTVTLINSGLTDLFINKCDSAGNILISRSAIGRYYERPTSIVGDTSGNFYAAGSFDGDTLIFDSDTLFNVMQTVGWPPAPDDIFIAKFNSNGNVLWAKSAGGNRDDYAYAMTTDIYGNVYIAGSFHSQQITFDGTTLTNPSSSSGGFKMFVAKIGNATGIHQNEIRKNEITISPNPANSSCTLSYNFLKQDHLELHLYNPLGTQVYFSKEQITSGKFSKEINVGNLSSGIYFLEVKTKEGVLNKKVVVQH